MSEGGRYKLLQAAVMGNIVVLITGLFLLGAWTNKIDTHSDNKTKHLELDTLQDEFMPRLEAEANFKAINEKLDILIDRE